MSNINSQESTRSFPIEGEEGEEYEEYEEYEEGEEGEEYEGYDEQWETYNERYADGEAEAETEGALPRIFCTICSQMVEPQYYTSHIQEHIRTFREVSTSFQTIHDSTNTFARLPHFHSLLDFPPLSSLSSLLSIPIQSSNNGDIQGVSFSNAFLQRSSPQFVYTTRFQLHYNPWLNDAVFDDYEANLRLADHIGKVEVGVSDIDRVSTKIDKHANDVSEDISCPICMENIKGSPDIQSYRVLLCKHTYCDECITRWLKTSKQCPVCKIDLEEKANESVTI